MYVCREKNVPKTKANVLYLIRFSVQNFISEVEATYGLTDGHNGP